MNCIIAGSRTIKDHALVYRIIESCPWVDQITEVLCGDAKGVDKIGAEWANSYKIPVSYHPVTKAEWAEFGKSAGPMRNRCMAQRADALILIWDGVSRGSANMLKLALEYNLEVYKEVVF